MCKLLILVMCLGMLAIGATAFAEGDYKYLGYDSHPGGLGCKFSSEGVLSAGGYGFGKSWGGYADIILKGASSEEKRERNTSNYGRTKVEENVEDAFGITIGVTRKVFEHLWLGVEGTVAWESSSDRYRDRRFTEDSYLVEEDDYITGGVGVSMIVPVFQQMDIIGSYNTYKGYGGGFIVRF